MDINLLKFMKTFLYYTVISNMESLGDKKGMLKNIIMQLHKGASIEEIRKDAEKILKELTPAEISEVEQEMIKEGVPREEIHKLCDIHLAVFKEAIEKSISPPKWHPIYILMEEHKILTKFANHLKEILMKEKNLEEVKNIVHHFKEAEKHYLREENVLFPYLEKHGITEPPAIMWMEHDKIRDIKKNIYKAVEEENFNVLEENASLLIETLSNHFYKENKVLFPTALKVVREDEWKEVRKQFDEIGYCCFTPEREKVEYEKEAQAKDGEIKLETGHFTKEELEAVLNSLPVDITFVDKNDEVKYFNQAKDRIFVRTKAIIGRKVQQCHPSKSVDVVERILKEFKEGKRDVAEFWLNIGGRKIHIRYFPVKRNGEYIGTLEVTQDITDIKNIEGEKRLLDL